MKVQGVGRATIRGKPHPTSGGIKRNLEMVLKVTQYCEFPMNPQIFGHINSTVVHVVLNNGEYKP